MSVSQRPAWLQAARVQWVEDDATRNDPSAERIEQAWRRIFGSDLAAETKVDEYDGDDTTWTLFASGRIEVNAFDGTGISLTDQGVG